jgi:hypothetical protein
LNELGTELGQRHSTYQNGLKCGVNPSVVDAFPGRGIYQFGYVRFKRSMAELTLAEKRALEQLFGMSTGYVLGFSNRTFREFILDVTGLNIDDVQIGRSGSKATRLRFFWTTQPNHIVGKLLRSLIEEVEKDSPLKERCRSIAVRLQTGHKEVMRSDETRIWGDSGFRVFLSHKSEVKAETGALKTQLEIFGISAFVAHADIEPTEEWQREIENALATMQAFVALMTEGFHNSKWTDQEVGYALARGVQIVPVKMGLDPYGFIGKFQALPCDWPNAPAAIATVLIKHPAALDAFVDAVGRCSGFDNGNLLSKVLPKITSLTPKQVESLVSSFNGNFQLQGSWGFDGSYKHVWGPGLAAHLTRITGEKYAITRESSSSTILVIRKE